MGLRIETSTSKITEDSIEHDISMYAGAYVYVNYTKGCESEVQLVFSVADSRINPNKAYPIVNIDHGTHSVTPVSIRLVKSQIFLLPIPVPESADKLFITPLVGAVSGTGGFGTLEININIDTVHH